jgi:hypothetical protein
MKTLIKTLLVLGLSFTLVGCSSLIPKRVEFFQDKVEAVPEMKASEKETQRRAAQRAEEKSRETLSAALGTQADSSVVRPAAETVLLTDAVAESVGPPLRPASDSQSSEALAQELRSQIAALNKRLDAYREDAEKNLGKKIEGSGLFSVPYFVWLGGFLVLAFFGFILLAVLWSFVKLYALSNPPVQLGVSAVQTSANFLKRALSEVAEGGEAFKESILSEVNDPELQKAIKELFKTNHLNKQSRDTQELIRAMTRKEI